MATSNLQQEIGRLRTLQESYDVIADNLGLFTEGKTDLATAITAKGVQTAATDSLATMADKVLQVPQQVNTRTSEFEQLIAPYPYIWNVYVVATDLMKNELPDYLPDYMQSYKSRYGTNAFFVGEYYLGYATLELTGADAYLTCDGDFYTLINGVVTHTLPDGSVEQYEAESIVHTWHDVAITMSNRWVAFFYLTDGYAFANVTSSICPRRVALCGNCMSLIISGENRLTDVWVIGSLKHIEGGTTGNTWNPAQVIRGYETHSGVLYNNPTTIRSIILPDLKVMAEGNILYAGVSCPLVSLSLPSLTTISGGYIMQTRNDNTDFASLTSISLPSIESISSITSSNKVIPKLSYIYVGYRTNNRALTVNLNGSQFPWLTDIELKEGYCKNLTCSSYTALTAENIVTHILNRLGVNQAYLDEPINANKLTITLGATNLAKLTDEEKQIAIDKGFTLA